MGQQPLSAGLVFFRKAAALVLLFSFILPPSVFAQSVEEGQSSTETPQTESQTAETPDASTETLVKDENQEEIMPPEESEELDPPEFEALFSGEPPLVYLQSQTKEKRSLVPTTDDTSGALKYSYELSIPPGRNGIQPQLNLSYSSQDTSVNNSLGQGWRVDIPYIQRINRLGSENLYSTTSPFFYSSVSGELATTSTPGTFYAKYEDGSFIKYVLSGNQWTATDKQGTTYKYGYATSTRQDNTGGTKIYRWMLEEIRDTNDNYVRYEYTKDSGQIYPDAIYYTGSGVSDGPFKIEFTKAARPDISTTTEAGFNIVSNYRLTKIQAKTSGTIVRVYDLAYTTGDNGEKSLLSSMTESGVETGATTTLPALQFKYASTTAKTFSIDSNHPVPEDPVAEEWYDRGVRYLDVNGDGYTDVLRSFTSDFSGNANVVYLHDHDNTGWTASSTWSNPEPFVRGGKGDFGVRFADLNGDGLVDMIRAYVGSEADLKKVYINNGITGWTYDSNWVVPAYFSDDGADTGSRLADINGDGYADFLRSSEGSGGTTQVVYINKRNGTGWVQDNNYTIPVYFAHDRTWMGVMLVDVNADGLTDILHSYDGAFQNGRNTYINKGDGTGWALDSSWTPPDAIVKDDTVDPGVRIADINADGLLDFLQSNNSGNAVYINTGSGFQEDVAYTIPYLFAYEDHDKGTSLEDIDSDGVVDFIENSVHRNNGKMTDLLARIDYPAGGSTDITYQTSSLYRDGSNNLRNPTMKVIVPTVLSIANADDIGATATETYEYRGGSFYYGSYLDRKFAGFNSIIKTDPLGYKTTNYFHQGNSSATTTGEYDDVICKLGRIYRTEIADGSSNIYSTAINKWEKADFDSGRCFVKITQSTQLDYDGDGDHKDKATAYTYNDTNGNLTQKVAWGEVNGSTDGSFSDTGSDKLTTGYMYVASSTGYLMGLQSQASTTNQSGTKIQETRRYYDNQSLEGVTKGNETKTENWRTASSYASTTQAYNSYGLVNSSVDPRGYTTSYTYDSLNLYPATTTNPLSQTIARTYDYSSGKVKIATDENGRQFETTYDGLDRPLIEYQPDITTPTTPVTKKTYTYTDTSNAKKILETNYLDSSNTARTYTYFDGLDRKLQTRKEAESGTQFSTRDFKYNGLGLVWKESLPYFSNGASRTSATGNSALYTTYAYDPMKRITSATTVVGATSNAYDQWTVTTTDPESNVKDFTYDAQGNLSQVVEHNGSNYTTAYEYDGNNNLTKITDADSNVRNFTYDGLNRRLTAEDIHDSGDGTFSSWSYTYDDSGNLTSQTDPKSQVVNLTYDGINRVLTEDYTGAAGTEITYGYDICAEGKPRLCAATTTTAITNFTYNALGLPATEKKTIDGTAYTTTYSYDRQGNQTNIVYPDSSEVRYVYNTAGLLETIEQKESGGSFAYVVSEFNYAPTEKTTFKLFGNGVGTTYTYNPDELYRLTNILTVASSTSGGGMMGFASDPWGNLALGDTNTFSLTTFDVAAFFADETLPADFAPLNEGVIEPTPEQPVVEEPLPTPVPEVVLPEPSPSDTASTTEEAATTTPAVPELPSEEVASSTATTTEPLPGIVVLDPLVEDALINPYIEKEDRLEFVLSKNLPEAGSASVELLKDRPEILLTKWDGEVSLGVAYEQVKATGTRAFLTDRMEWKGEKEEVHAYPLPAQEGMEDGGFEVEVYLKEKPETNIFDFSISGAENLDFFYQPELTKEEIDEGGVRPENVIGSYAVYHKEKRDHLVGETNYGTGKAFHIYRPKAIDANGNEAWGTLAYENGTLRVEIPQDFLEKATYPVRVDPTFGYTTIGGTTISTTNAGGISGTPTTSGSLTQISTYGRASSGTISLASALYSDSAGSPNTKIAEDSGNITANTSAAWRNVNVSASTTASTPYWLMFWPSASFVYYYDTVTNARKYKSPTFENWPSPFGSPTVSSSKSSTYGTYTEVPVAPTAPTSLQAEGLTNPTGLTDTTPELSAIYNDPNTVDTAEAYQIQVGTSTAFTSNVWDSGKLTIASSTPQGTRSPEISYAGISLATTTTYYWRIKFWDAADLEGAWSTATSTFALASSTSPVIPAGGDIQNISFTYSAAGNINKITDVSGTGSGKVVVFGYDNLYRLTSASTTAASSTPYKHSYTYSPIGNISSSTPAGAYVYGETGQTNPHAATSIGGTSLTYDNNGNLTAYGSQTYTWDYRNRLATSTNGTSVGYAYDFQNERVRKSTGTATTTYANRFYNVASTTKSKHIFTPSGDLVATFTTVGASTTKQYIHGDQLGGSTVSTDSTGAASEMTEYYPYGSERVALGSVDEQRKFAAMERDYESGLDYAMARYYRPATGAFISQDPVFWEVGQTEDGKSVLLNPQAQNSYSYAGNNPLINKDPSGRIIDTIADAGFIAYDLYKLGEAYAKGGNVNEQIGYLGLDLAGAAIPGATGFGVAGRMANVAQKVNRTQNVVATANNYRPLYEKAYGQLKSNIQVHHTLPQKYESLFKEAGINIHELKYLEAVSDKVHKQISNAWRDWDKAQKGNITAQKVRDFAGQIQKEFGKSYKKKSKGK